ncbi:fungal specific transcription factor, putative [Aspergillus fumigatus Z5]|nr:fungal specific transcription factor, putative [Aspergillus fumigatus Z5]
MLREQVVELSLGQGLVDSDRMSSSRMIDDLSLIMVKANMLVGLPIKSVSNCGTEALGMCQVECIRCNDLPDAMTDLLDSAMQIISAVMDFVKYCDQEDSIRQQYTWIACVDVTKVIIRLLDDTLDYPSGKQRADGPQHATGNRPALNSDDRVHEL